LQKSIPEEEIPAPTPNAVEYSKWQSIFQERLRAEREPIKSHLSRLVLAPSFFVILIVTASFTAGLTSGMTASHIKPSVLDVETLQKNKCKSWVQSEFFRCKVFNRLLKFKPENIRRVHSISMKDYPEAFERDDITAKSSSQYTAKATPY
jgi:hypothetical protein